MRLSPASGAAAAQQTAEAIDLSGFQNIVLDFINQEYTVGGFSVNINSLFSNFDSDRLIEGEGYEVGDGLDGLDPIGLLLDSLAIGVFNGMTLVCGFSTRAAGDATGQIALFFATDPEDPGELFYDWINLAIAQSGAWQAEISYPSEIVLRPTATWDPNPGQQCIAATFSKDIGGGSHEFAISINGQAVATDTAPDDFLSSNLPPIGTVRIFGWHENFQYPDDIYIERLEIMAPVDSSELPALSSITTL